MRTKGGGMRLKGATSTNIISFSKDGSKREMREIIPQIAKAGFDAIDLNFCELMNPSSDLNDKAKQTKYISCLERYKTELGISYVQSHVPYARDYLALDEDEKAAIDRLIRRGIADSRALGIKTIVIHPIIGTVEQNITYFRTILPLLGSSHLAIENMDTQREIHTMEDLIAIIKGLGDERVGICLDTGHAHIATQDVPREIRHAGSYLIATHIADNHGTKDEHLLPYYGTINWDACIQAIKEIGYAGYLTYEIMYFTKDLSAEAKETALSLAKSTLTYLCQ